MIYVIIPIDDSFQEDEDKADDGSIMDTGDIAIFKTDTQTYEEVEEMLFLMAKRGKISTYIIIDQGFLDEAYPLNELFRASLLEDMGNDTI